MEHLEEVVRERNKAFHRLEVGVSGEREREYRLVEENTVNTVKVSIGGL